MLRSTIGPYSVHIPPNDRFRIAIMHVPREYIEDMQAAIMAEFEKGTQMGQIPQAVQLPKYENWAMYDEWLALNVWRVMLDMHMGPFPWRPDEP